MEAFDIDDFEHDASEASTDEKSSRRLRHRFRLLLEGGSIALFAIFLFHLIPVLLQANPLNPQWQGEFVDVLVNEGLLAFLGFVLLHLARFIQPSHDPLRHRLRLVRRLAVLAVTGYLLLVPLQVSSAFGELASAQSKRVSYLERGARLAEVREALQNASSTQDLNVRLQSLLEPELTAVQMRKPMDDLRKMLLKENDIQQQKLSKLLMTNAEGEEVFSAINRVGSSLGWALAFASGAVPWGSHSTLLERLRRRSRPKT